MASLDRVYTLPPFSELRIVTSGSPKEGTRVLLQVPMRAAGDDGPARSLPRADIFGSELVPGVATQLPPARSISVFTPTGCTLTVTAPPAVLQRCYATTGGAAWVRSLLSLHSHLEVQRMEARVSGSEGGPRVLVVSEDRLTGASTYVRMLAAYAVRLGYHPLLLDAAVEHPAFGYPGCLSLYHLQHTLDTEEETSFLPGVHVFAGGARAGGGEGLYLHGIRELANLGVERMARSDRCRVGGLFIDYGCVTAAAVEAAERDEARGRRRGGDGGGRGTAVANPLDLLLDTIAEVAVDHVFVVQSGWLRHKLAQRARERLAAPGGPSHGGEGGGHMLSAPMEVVSEAHGVAFRLFLVDGLDHVRSFPPGLARHQRWMQYFFGTATSPVRPTLVQLDTAAIRIASVGSSQQSALSTLMPMMDEGTEGGAGSEGGHGLGTRKVDPAAVSFVTAQDADLKGRILGISSATERELLPDGSLQRVPYAEFERRVRQGVLLGFALVESVSPDKVTLLLNDVAIDKDLGICLVLTEEYLVKQP